MQAQPPRRRKVLVEGVPDQDVREAQAAARLGHGAHQPRARCLVERREQRILVHLGEASDHVGIELPPDHRREGEQVPAALGLPGEPLTDDLEDALRNRDPTRRAVAVALGSEQPPDLLGEQRVALRIGVDRGRQLVRRGIAHRQVEQARRVGSAQPAQREPLHPGIAGDVGERLGKLRSDLGVPVAADDENRRCGELPGHEAQEQQRGRIGRVQVVQPDDHRSRRRRIAQERCDGLEQSEAGPVGVGGRRLREVGHQAPELGKDGGELGPLAAELGAHGLGVAVADVRAQRLDPRPVGRGAARLPAPADVHPRSAPPGVATHLLGQPALADARLAGDEDQPSLSGQRLVERGHQRGELMLASDEGVPRGSELRLARRGEVEAWVLAQDRLLELAQLPSRLDSEPVDEGAAGVLIRGQCLRLSPRSVQGQHELAAQALAQRMLGDQRLELAHHAAAAQRQVGLDAIAHRIEPALLQPRDLGLRKRRKRQVRQGRAAPQRQRLAEALAGRRGRALRKLRTTLADQALEAVQVQGVGLDPEDIAGRPGDEQTAVRIEQLAQRRDIELHELGRGRGRPLAPELVDDPIARHDLVRVEQQQRQDRPLLRRPELDRHTLDHRLERAEKPELDHLTSDPNRAQLLAVVHGSNPASGRPPPAFRRA